jgi:ribosome-associated heat shock protein Hsp15
VVKARTSAAELVVTGHVRINGTRETSPGHAIKIGDVITVALDRTVRVLKVTAFIERRGDAASARVLYEELVRELRAAQLPVATGEFQAMMRVALVNDGPVTLLLELPA